MLHIDDLSIAEGESLAFYGLPEEYSELLINLLTGATISR